MNDARSDRAKELIDELALLGTPRTQGEQLRVFQLLKDLEALGGTHVAEHLISTRDLGLKILLGDFLSFTHGVDARRAFTHIFEDTGEPEESRARAAYHLGFTGDETTLATLLRVTSDPGISPTIRLGAVAGIRAYYAERPYAGQPTDVLDVLTEVALHVENHPLRREAVRTLGALRYWKAGQPLVRVLRYVRHEWSSQHGEEERRALAELGGVAIAAMAETGHIDTPVLDVLTKTYELDEDFKGPVIQALGKLHGKHHRQNGIVSRQALDFLLRHALEGSSDDYLLTLGARALVEIGLTSREIIDALRVCRRRVTDRFSQKTIDEALSKLQAESSR